MSTHPSSSTDSSYNMSGDVSKPESSFDMDDPFEFLLQGIANSPDLDSSPSSSSQENSPSDWPQAPSWVSQDSKILDFASDFSFNLPMDLDFDPTVSVEPSTLHFNPSLFSQQSTGAVAPESTYFQGSSELASELASASMFPFDHSTWNTAHVEPTGRRLSVTSSSSSSGASLSPVPEHSIPSSASSDSGNTSETDLASEIARRVCQLAGVRHAVPVGAQFQQMVAAGGQAKLPIPRLPRPSLPTAPAKRSSIKSSPSPEPSLSSSSSPSPSLELIESQSLSSNPPASSPGSSIIAPPTTRPKTSHTTIERRYRTNLNARITGLKESVPALRILEPKKSAQFNDVVDSRGFVDGVKVAKKMSKGNILGKATEYIRVLKKRETRLKREQDGLKKLIIGLVGGPEMLAEWERTWREAFGGEENDEVEDEGLGCGSDDEDGDGEDSGVEDDEGRARKKVKVTKNVKKERAVKPSVLPVAPTVPGAVPEKRKRGRPRKNPLPPVPVIAASTPAVLAVMTAPTAHPTDQSHPVPMQQDVVQHNTQPAQQYLLAAFAFFSVFNSPLTSNYSQSHAYNHHHAHHGTVVTNHPAVHAPPLPTSSFSIYGYGAHELAQAFHLLVSTLVFFYVLLPWLSNALRRNSIASTVLSYLSPYFSRTHAQTSDSKKSSGIVTSDASKDGQVDNRELLMEALAPSRRGAVDEAIQLRKSLGVSTGLLGLMQGVIKAARHDRGIELNQLEQRAWVRLGELVAFDGTVPRTTRLQTYWCMSWHISTFSASTIDLSTLALIIQPVHRSKATELWERARNRDILRPYERIVLSNMSVHAAADWLSKWRLWHETERKSRCAACEKRTPLGVLAAILIRERLRKHAAAMFVRTVVPYPRDEDNDDMVYDAEKEFKEEQERRETIEAGKSIGGRTAELAMLLERIWDTGFCSHEDVLTSPGRQHKCAQDEDVDCEDEHDLASTDEAEIRALLSVTLMYRRIFPSSFPSCGPSVSLILSPPPSPSRKNVALHTALKTALDSPAFEASGRFEDENLAAALEMARDRVVDMLTELQRAARRNCRY